MLSHVHSSSLDARWLVASSDISRVSGLLGVGNWATPASEIICIEALQWFICDLEHSICRESHGRAGRMRRLLSGVGFQEEGKLKRHSQDPPPISVLHLCTLTISRLIFMEGPFSCVF